MQGRVLLKRYEVVRQLGEGGMGKVYLARQTDLQRQVVIKVMHDDVAADPKFRERFQREMLLMANFQHPFAVTLYDAVLTSDDGPCIVMEYIRGDTLDLVLMRNKRLSAARTGRILGQVCEALQAAHQLGVIHRDLKPGNIMVVDGDTPYEKVKVMDFGLAKLIERKPQQVENPDSSECAIGTPAYMCPEQIQGEDTDHRGDIYSVGVMLYELLTGRLPYDKPSTMEMFLAHTLEAPPQMAFGDFWVPPAIERVVMACLEKQPGKRPASARELAQRYDEALQANESVPDLPPPEAPVELEEVASFPSQVAMDPSVVTFQLQAWMPESVAAYKLKGFVQDAGGEVVESVPGKIRVRMGGKGSTYRLPPSGLAWLGIGSKQPIELELHLIRGGNSPQSNLQVSVILRYHGRFAESSWKALCNQIFIDLRGYLIGQGGNNPS